MKQKLTFVLVSIIIFLSGCSNKNSLYQNGQKELENGNYENAIMYFTEYQNTYNDTNPLKDSYCKYADFLYLNDDYIDSLYYYKLAYELDNTDSETKNNILELTNTIYKQGKQFLNNNNDLLAYQYL